MGRLIDADKLKNALYEDCMTAMGTIDESTLNLLMIEIDEIPTAYDMDKVVEELKKRANLQDRVALSISDYAERYCHIKSADAYRQAILIVKGAVKDEYISSNNYNGVSNNPNN